MHGASLSQKGGEGDEATFNLEVQLAVQSMTTGADSTDGLLNII